MNIKPLIANLDVFTNNPFLNTETHTYSYADLKKEVLRQLNYLKENEVAQHSTVFIQGDFSLSSIALFLALYQNDNVIALNTAANEQEMANKIAVAQAQYLIDTETAQIIRYPMSTQENPLMESLKACGHAGLILFSSGTTSEPKAMLHDLSRLVESYQHKRPRRLSIFLFLLFDHIGGINTLLNILSIGGTATIARIKSPDVVASLIEKYRITVLPTSPTFLNLMLISNVFIHYDLGALRMITYGTEPMPESLLVTLRAYLPHVKFLQTFGTSETGIMNTDSLSSDSLFMRFQEGDTEYRIVDGELWLRSGTQIMGYLNYSMDNFTKDGWFKTGDLVEINADGYLKILGRSKEIINVGGEKVYPAEVESVLMQHPQVKDCKAYGEQNGLTGQFVAAEVVLDADYGETSNDVLRAIRQFCREHMDNYKVPIRLKIVEAIRYSSRYKKLLIAS
ncbi:fatty acid--CoA ligase family protein [Serratia sp. JSRIV004]|uniref:ANL family adenylate-forming protein n=1 Tax=Serratia sp. JSRIV004 TaxID=2831895 RepID=UPI001CC08FBC|nr:fatty acid--CoA ligase family protein [Serratia sp. JSRIV004]UAN56751.1 long-chain fatty acid--CoA ligase [Serratia sp. JSRIV004]